MSLKPLKDIVSTDVELSQLVSTLREWSKQFKDIPFLDGRLIEDIVVTTSTVSVAHKLSRQPRGWFIVSKNANADVWESSKSSSYLVLDSSATVTISIWVF